MANRVVSLVYYCRTPEGWRRYPAVFSKNGRIKPGVVLVDGEERAYEGTYQLRSYAGKQPIYKSVGKGAREAWSALEKAQQTAGVKADAAKAGIKLVEDEGRTTLETAFRRFYNQTRDRGSLVAADVYRVAVQDFLQRSHLEFTDEVTQAKITHWMGSLRRRDYSDRTVFNHYSALKAFLLSMGMKEKLPRAPRYEKALPQVYTDAQMKSFFASIKGDTYLTVVFSVLLYLGLREQEAMYLEWTDVNWQGKTIRVQSKAKWGFKVKDCEQRDIPIPAVLFTQLEKWKKKRPAHALITGTVDDKPNGKLLRILKRAVHKADLHCGSCDGCKSKSHECRKWILHRFRATYITRLLRGGVDLRTVMSLSGHSDLASVMRYLRPAEGHSLMAKVNAVFG